MGSRKKILFLSNVYPSPPQPTKGVFNRDMIGALRSHNDVQVIAPVSWLTYWAHRLAARDWGDTDTHYPAFYYPPRFIHSYYGLFLWWSVRRLALRLVRSHPPDAILAYWAHPDGEAGLRLARLLGVPCVVMVGGSDVLVLTARASRRRVIQRVLNQADAVVVVSKDIEAKIVALGISKEKVHVVHRGVNTGLFCRGDSRAARRRQGLADNTPVLLWVGRMVAVKGLDILLQACARLRDKGLDFHLYLVGDGPLRPALTQLCHRQNLTGLVSFVGPIAHDKLPDWFRAADLTVLPSRSEGIPNVLRETLACGTPFVASAVGGIPEISRPGACRLVRPGDPERLAEAIEGSWAAKAAGTLGPVSGARPLAEAASDLDNLINQVVAAHSRRRPSGTRAQHGFSLARQLAKYTLGRLLPRSRFLMRGPAQSRSVCLTFDDGPHPEHTPRLLESLDKLNARATFFVVGNRAVQHPELIREIARRGHDLGNHSYWHHDPSEVSADDLMAEIDRTKQSLQALIEKPLPSFRPPHGKLSLGKLWTLWRHGQGVVLWSKDPRDYACASAEELQEWFVRNPLESGDIVLLHDNCAHAAHVLPQVVTAARERGIDFVRISDWTQGESCR